MSARLAPPQNPRLTALWLLQPHDAAAEVLRALEDHATVEGAAGALHVASRTLYRWIASKPQLLHQKGPMKPRELRGAINRAKNVYAYVHYNPVNAFFTKLSKESARELADDAHEETAEVEATVKDGELYIGHVPPDEVETDGREANDEEEEEESDEEESEEEDEEEEEENDDDE